MTPAGPRSGRGAVYLGRGRGFAIEPIVVDPPRRGEVRVRMAAAGVCHSDLHVVDDEWARPAPVVMGHEGAAFIEAVGPGVADRAVGDLVVLAWTAPCGGCGACHRGQHHLCADPRGADHRTRPDEVRVRRPDGSPLGAYSGIGTFGEWQVVAAEAAIPVPPDTAPDVAALIGCAVTTGVGAALWTAAIQRGESVAVIGLGGIGLSAVMGAVRAGAGRIVAIDRQPAKLAVARGLGASDTVAAEGSAGMTLAAVRALVPDGLDHAIEAIGLPATVELAIELVRPGGTATLVGMTPQGVRAGIDVYRFVERGIRLLGSNYGSALPAAAFSQLATWANEGRLPVERLIGARIGLDDLGAAFDALRNGQGGRQVIVFGPPANDGGQSS